MRILVLPSLLFATVATAQQVNTVLQASIRYVATEANAPPGACGCFLLQGAAADVALPVAKHFSAVVELGGVTVHRVPGSPRGLSELTLLAGPRYTQPLGRVRLNVQALFGAVRGFDSDFTVTPTTHTDTSTNFATTLGGALDVPMTRTFSLRAAQVEFLQTNLPNGVDNRQRNIRFGAGVVLNFRVPSGHR